MIYGRHHVSLLYRHKFSPSILGKQPNKTRNYFSSICTNLHHGRIKCLVYTSTQSLQLPRTFQHCRLCPPPECTGVKRAVRELEAEKKTKNKMSMEIQLNL